MGKNDKIKPGPSGASKLKKAKKNSKNESQSGPSTSSKSNDPSTSSNTKVKRIRFADEPNKSHQYRRPSNEPLLRYKSYFRPRSGTIQDSHTVRNLVQRPTQEKREALPQRTIRYVAPTEPIDRDRHVSEAIDFYYRSTQYSQNRESLADLRKKYMDDSRMRTEGNKPVKPEQNIYFRHFPRCQNCLYGKVDCVCRERSSEEIQNIKSDWKTMTRYGSIDETETPKSWTRNRLNWLESIENNIKLDKQKLIDDNFSESHEICCFPFNTFNIFAKRQRRHVDFYTKDK